MSEHADLILANGKVWTGHLERLRRCRVKPGDPVRQHWVSREGDVAIAGERIVAVGDVEGLRGPSTQVVDCKGRLVAPGFHDSHVHFAGGCLQLQRVDLRDAEDEAEFGRRLREFGAKLPEGAWMVGGRWDHDLTFGGAFPTAEILDRYVADRPVFVRRYDGHIAVANSLAMRIAGVTAETPDPEGGALHRDADGVPNGVLADTAMDIVWRHIPDPTADDIAKALPGGLELAARMGITSVHDMLGDGGPCLEAYRRLDDAGELTVRMNLYWGIGDWETGVRHGRDKSRPYGAGSGVGGSSRVSVRGVKAFVDGSLGACTAWFHQPYACDGSTSGLACADMEWLAEEMKRIDEAGMQLAVHAIGDRAVSELLDAWEALVEANGERDRRLRMEHAQHIRAEDVERFGKLGVVGSVQPYHVIDDARFCESRIGKERCAEAYAFRSLLSAGTRLALGSDWPVAPLDVIAGIDAAVNRRPEGEADAWYPEQRICVDDALAGYTLDAARAAFAEDELGTIEEGKLADIVVLDRDITDEAEMERIGETEVALTVGGGRVIHDRT
ncbi:MAG TPA: amidohydrolase [Armatimonadota bacterium]|nr:amidohydrolase [Armatimonadota bacterium]